MDAFVLRKRKRDEAALENQPRCSTPAQEESTDFKLALLASLHPAADETTLLEALLASDGSVDQASTCLTQTPRKRVNAATGYQSSLSLYRLTSNDTGPAKKPLVKKGKTLYLFDPEDIEQHTPCSIIHNFLPPQQANALLQQLLDEKTYPPLEFKLFDRVVTSPHTYSFYVNSLADAEEQKTQYLYDGRPIEVRIRLTSAEVIECPAKSHRTSNRAHHSCSPHSHRSRTSSTAKSPAEPPSSSLVGRN